MRAKFCCFLCIWKLKVGGKAWEIWRVVYVYIFVAFTKSLFLRFNFDGSFDQNYIELLIVVDSNLDLPFHIS